MSEIRIAGQSGRQPLEPFTALLLALRSDLGHRNEDIDGYTLVTLFVNDLSREKWENLVKTGSFAG